MSSKDYLALVRAFADRTVTQFRDPDLPLYADGIHLDTGEPVGYEHEFRGHPGGALCNVAFQQNWMRMLVSLSRLTGEMRYENAAKETLAHFIQHFAHPDSGLLPWGGHMYLDLDTRTIVGHQHELKFVYPFYELMCDVRLPAMVKYVNGLFHAHMKDWDAFVINRHGPFDGTPTTGQLSFLNTGSDMILAATTVYARTGEGRFLEWAHRLAKCYADARDPETGLGPYQYSERPKQDARRLFGPGYSELNIQPYARRYTHLDLILLHASSLLGDDDGRDFRRWAMEDLEAYPKYGYDPATDGFYTMLCCRTGRRLTPDDFVDPSATYFAGPQHYEKKGLPFLTDLLRPYAYGVKMTGDGQLMETAQLILRLLGLEHPAAVDKAAANGEVCAGLIHGLLDLSDTTNDKAYVEQACRIAENGTVALSADGRFLREKGETICWLNQRLPLALLRLHAHITGSAAEIAPDLSGAPGTTFVK